MGQRCPNVGGFTPGQPDLGLNAFQLQRRRDPRIGLRSLTLLNKGVRDLSLHRRQGAFSPLQSLELINLGGLGVPRRQRVQERAQFRELLRYDIRCFHTPMLPRATDTIRNHHHNVENSTPRPHSVENTRHVPQRGATLHTSPSNVPSFNMPWRRSLGSPSNPHVTSSSPACCFKLPEFHPTSVACRASFVPASQRQTYNLINTIFESVMQCSHHSWRRRTTSAPQVMQSTQTPATMEPTPSETRSEPAAPSDDDDNTAAAASDGNTSLAATGATVLGFLVLGAVILLIGLAVLGVSAPNTRTHSNLCQWPVGLGKSLLVQLATGVCALRTHVVETLGYE